MESKTISSVTQPVSTDTERLLHVFLTFAGRLEKSQDPVAQDAARRLHSELKGVKIKNDNS